MRQRRPHSGAFLDEATRFLILIVAEQETPKRLVRRSGRGWRTSSPHNLRTPLSLRGAHLPSATGPVERRTPLDGAFGINFGSEGVKQLESLLCLGSEKGCLASR